MTLAVALLVFLAVRASLHLVVGYGRHRPTSRPVTQPLISQRPLLGRWSLLSVKGVAQLAQHGPDLLRSSPPRLPSSPPHSQVYPALGAGGVPLAVLDGAPNVGAFSAGVELGIFTALFTISSLLVLNWIVRTMRSSK